MLVSDWTHALKVTRVDLLKMCLESEEICERCGHRGHDFKIRLNYDCIDLAHATYKDGWAYSECPACKQPSLRDYAHPIKHVGE